MICGIVGSPVIKLSNLFTLQYNFPFSLFCLHCYVSCGALKSISNRIASVYIMLTILLGTVLDVVVVIGLHNGFFDFPRFVCSI